MRSLYILSFFLIILFSNSCKTQQLIIDKDLNIVQKDLGYKITDFNIDKNIIIIDVNYKGCGNEKFSLVFNKSYLKSFPPQAILYLQKEKSDDSCVKELSKKLKFDISKVAYPKSKKVYIRLYSFDNKKLEYNY